MEIVLKYVYTCFNIAKLYTLYTELPNFLQKRNYFEM